MTGLPLSDDVLALNPELRGQRVRASKDKKAQDEAGLFWEAWKQCAADQPEPTSEMKFAPYRRFKFDWAFTAHKLAVEVDGGNHMVRENARGEMVPVGQHVGKSEREKMNLAAMMGWRVMHFTPQDLKRDPAGCVEQVLQALAGQP